MDRSERAAIAALIGMGGAAVMAAIGVAAGGGTLGGAVLPVAAAGGGAFLAGLATARFFGRPGGRGAALAAAGALLATGGGAALGAGFLAGPSGFLAGPVFVALSLVEAPAVALVWAAAMILAQFGARRVRGGATPGSSGCP